MIQYYLVLEIIIAGARPEVLDIRKIQGTYIDCANAAIHVMEEDAKGKTITDTYNNAIHPAYQLKVSCHVDHAEENPL